MNPYQSFYSTNHVSEIIGQFDEFSFQRIFIEIHISSIHRHLLNRARVEQKFATTKVALAKENNTNLIIGKGKKFVTGNILLSETASKVHANKFLNIQKRKLFYRLEN